MRAFSIARLALCAAAALAGCGARTGVIDPDAGFCGTDEECADGLVCTGIERCVMGRCRGGPPPECDDRDPCTADSCAEPGGEAGAGGCVHATLRTDSDDDGYDAILDDNPAMCGDDCDDSDPAVHPGAPEVCNGKDDDCDRAIDEGASYMPEGTDQRLTMDDAPSSEGAVSWSPATRTWGVTFWTYAGGSADVFFQALEESGRPMAPPQLLTREPGDAFGAGIVWTGREFGVVWQDRRDGDFELYFNRLTPEGEKLSPDYRVTYAPGWSINESMVWTGSEFAIVWQDGRDQIESPENYEVYLTFLAQDGFEIGDDLRLTHDLANSESPTVALGDSELGIAFLDGRTGEEQIWLLTTDLTGQRTMSDTLLSTGSRHATDPAIAYAAGAFVVAWEDRSAGGDADIYAVRVPRNPAGPIEGPFAIETGPAWSRGPRMLSNGDRIVLAFSDDRAGHFEIYEGLFDPRLARIEPDVLVTAGAGDSVYGGIGRGRTSVGVLFNDQRDGNWEVYFTRLLCAGEAIEP